MDTHAPGAPAPVQAISPVTFQFHSVEVRTVDRDGQVWFVAGDVAMALGYSETKDMTRFLDEDEADRHIMPVRSENGTLQTREVTIISESGLYHALLKSRKREAKPFRKWVTSEVLPTIRRSGGYRAAPESDDLDLRAPMEAVQRFWEECEATVRASGGTVLRWPDADLRDLALGLVGNYLAHRARFLLTFDHAGTPQLQFLPQDASLVRPQAEESIVTLITEILDRKGLLIAYKAASERLMRMAQKELRS